METIAKYLGMTGVFGLLGSLIGWWRHWVWVFAGCLILSFILFVILQKRGNLKR